MTDEEMEKAIKLIQELIEKYEARAKEDKIQASRIEETSAHIEELLKRRGEKMESHLSHSAKVEKAYMILAQLKRKLMNGQDRTL